MQVNAFTKLAGFADQQWDDVAAAEKVARLRQAALSLPGRHNQDPPPRPKVATPRERPKWRCAKDRGQPLPQQPQAASLLYMLAVNLLRSGHPLAARAILVALLPTHAGLAPFWIRLGEACMHAASMAADCHEKAARSSGTATSKAARMEVPPNEGQRQSAGREPSLRSGKSASADDPQRSEVQLLWEDEPSWFLHMLPCAHVAAPSWLGKTAGWTAAGEAAEAAADFGKVKAGRGKGKGAKKEPTAGASTPASKGAVSKVDSDTAAEPEPGALMKEAEAAFGNALCMLTESHALEKCASHP